MEQNGTCSDRSWGSPIVIKAIPKDWDVFDYPSMDKFPEVGLEKTAYIDLSTNSIYRWDKETEEYVAIGGGGGGAGFEARIVDELPETGENGVMYLVPNGGATGNTYDEFLWIESESKFEKVGTTEVIPPEVVQETGQSMTAVMSQKAVTDKLTELEGEIPELLTTTGQSTTASMTQKAITDALASAGGAKVLTTDDYNWPTSNPDGVALWTLDSGIYVVMGNIKYYVEKSSYDSGSYGTAIVSRRPDNYTMVTFLTSSDATTTDRRYIYNSTRTVDSTSGVSASRKTLLDNSKIKNNLTSTSSDYFVLDARQGKVLKDMIGNLTDLETTDQSNLVSAINEVASSFVKELTVDDYNFPANNPTGIAWWLLDDGFYHAASGVNVYYTNADSNLYQNTFWVMSFASNSNRKMCITDYIGILNNNDGSVKTLYYYKETTDSYPSVVRIETIDNLTSTSLNNPLSARQGKVLNDKIDQRIVFGGTSAPTTSTVGQVSTLYVCVINLQPKMYVCTEVNGGVYTWTEFVAGQTPGPDVDPTDKAMTIPDSVPVEDGEVDLSGTGAEIVNNTLDLGA